LIVIAILSIIIGAHLYPEFYKKNRIESYQIGAEFPDLNYVLNKSESNENKKKLLSYEANLNSISSFSLGTKNIDIALSFESKSTGTPKDELDKTTVFDLQLMGHKRKKFLWELYYQNYQGLYIIDKDDELEAANKDYRASSYSYGLNLKYFTKDDYDVKKSFSHFGKLKEKNWSFFHSLYVDVSKLYGQNGSLVPPEYYDELDSIKHLTEIETKALGYDFGITGMYTYEYFYVSSLFGIGKAIQYQHVAGTDQGDRYIMPTSVNVAVDFGFKVNNKSAGFQIIAHGIDQPVKDAVFSKTRESGQMYFKYFF